MKHNISIIMSTKGRRNIFLRSIEALHLATNNNSRYELIVVNDELSQPVCLPREISNIKILNNAGTGYASAMNTGANQSSNEYLLFVDNDIIINEAFLSRIDQFIQDYPDCLLNPNWIYPKGLLLEMEKSSFGRFLLREKEYKYETWYNRSTWNDKELFEAEILASFCLLVSRNVFNKVNGFNENYTYLSIDDEFTKKAKTLGFNLYIDPAIYVEHNEADRLVLVNKLNRLYLMGKTRRQRFDEGFNEYELNFSKSKIRIIKVFLPFRQFLLYCSKIFPNIGIIDIFYKKLVSLLIIMAIYSGYYNIKFKLDDLN